MRKCLILMLVALAACTVPKHVGGGRLHRVPVPPGFEIAKIHVSPGEEYVLCEAPGLGQARLLYTGEMVPVEGGQYYWETFAFGPEAKRGFCLTPDKGLEITVPELCPVRAFGKPKTLLSVGAETVRLPGSRGWVVTTLQRGTPNVWLIEGSPKNFARSGSSALRNPIQGQAVDERTGLLVLTDGGKRLELFDLDEMRSQRIIDLPCRRTSGSIVARQGIAWVGTEEGTVIPIRLESGEVAAPIGMGGPGVTLLAFSESSGILAVFVQDRSSTGRPYPTHIKVFITGEGRLVGIGSGYMEIRGKLTDVEVLETTQNVAFVADGNLYTWRYRE